MNISIILYFLGWVLKIEAIFMLLPCTIAVIYQEKSGIYFLIVGLVSGVLGWLISRKLPQNRAFYAREGFVSVALCWIVLSFFGALPFYLNGISPLR